MSTGEKSNSADSTEKLLLTPCEFEIMEILWKQEWATVRDVFSVLKLSRGLAYTTVMTVMDKLHRKRALFQRRRGRAYQYSARISRGAALRQRLEHLIAHYFRGSPQEFMNFVTEEFDSRSPERINSGEHPSVGRREDDMDTVLL